MIRAHMICVEGTFEGLDVWFEVLPRINERVNLPKPASPDHYEVLRVDIPAHSTPEAEPSREPVWLYIRPVTRRLHDY